MRRLLVAAIAASLSAAAGAAKADNGWTFTASIKQCTIASLGGVCPPGSREYYPNAVALPDAQYIPGGLSLLDPQTFQNYNVLAIFDVGADVFTYATIAITRDQTVNYTYHYRSTDVADAYFDPAGIMTSSGYSVAFNTGPLGPCPTFGRCADGNASFDVKAGDTVTVFAGAIGDGWGYGESSIQFIGDLFDSNVPQQGVPEPAGWLLMILGFGAVGAVFRRRMAAGAPAAAG